MCNVMYTYMHNQVQADSVYEHLHRNKIRRLSNHINIQSKCIIKCDRVIDLTARVA